MDNIFSENILRSIGIIVVLFGIIAAHRLVSSRDKRSVFISASARLVEAFAPAIIRLDAAISYVGSHDQPDVSNFLQDNFETHAVAIKRFEEHLSWSKRKRYKKAWKEYCDLEPNGGGITLFAGHYAPPGKYLEYIKERIENVLKFAKHK